MPLLPSPGRRGDRMRPDVHQAARVYIVVRGWRPVPIPFGEKGPVLEGWQQLALTVDDLPRYFNGPPQNTGILNGRPVDIDLDAPEAVRLADAFLPPTPSIFGRPSKPRPHREDTRDSKTEKFCRTVH